jgi:hypothetical protein
MNNYRYVSAAVNISAESISYSGPDPNPIFLFIFHLYGYLTFKTHYEPQLMDTLVVQMFFL